MLLDQAQQAAQNYVSIARKRNRFGSTETTIKVSAAMSMLSDAQEFAARGAIYVARASILMDAAKMLLADIIDVQEAIIPEIDCAFCGKPFATVGLVCQACSGA